MENIKVDIREVKKKKLMENQDEKSAGFRWSVKLDNESIILR